MNPRSTWTPLEVKLLRTVQNLSQRAFATRLGYAQSTVVGWEREQRTAPLQHETIEVLNVELDRLPTDKRDLFDRERGVAGGQLGAGSATRTAALLAAAQHDPGPALPYVADDRVIGSVRAFLDSTARVFLVTGAAGTGKTSLTQEVARQFVDDVDCQLLAVTSWETNTLDLAAEILRYASIPRGDDALLTLEEHSSRLTRPLVVLVDGLASHDAFATIGRRIDTILRQVTTPALRFLPTVRTPPAIETTAHPLLHASLFRPAGAAEDAAHLTLTPWSDSQARACWEQVSTIVFDRLPPGVRQLVRTPLYTQLALDAALATTDPDLGSYALLEHCVRRALSTGSREHHFRLLSDLAHHQAHAHIPTTLSRDTGVPPEPNLTVELPATLVHTNHHRQVEFTHDVLREFFLSTRLAELLQAQGRSITTVRALNELADRATTSSTARSIFDLVLQRLDALDPTLLESVATAPTASVTSTVPLMITLAGDARFLTPEMLRSCATRAAAGTEPTLSRALLLNTRVHQALGTGRYRWLLALLRQFGPTLWAEVTTFVEETFDTTDAYTLLDLADLAHGEEATFFARHFYLFFGRATDNMLETLLGHANWRVRAALAEALRDIAITVDETALAVMARLVRDRDYKVRAAVAPVITRAPGRPAVAHLTALLNDDNWHVRERALQGLDQLGLPARRPDLIAAGLTITATESSWAHTPAHVQPSRERLHLLHTPANAEQPILASGEHHRALVTILREIRTGHLTPPQPVRERLLEQGLRSDRLLVRSEAERTAACPPGDAPRRIREQYRRHRNRRSIQIALDLHDITDAIRVARAAADAGADFVEVGDPLIKAVGVTAIEQVKTAVPDMTVVAEMMSADWGRDQVVIAAQAGADVVQLIGPATTASVRAAADAGRRLAVPVLLDAPVNTSHHWVTEMERAGIDGFTVTTNIDIGIGSATSLDAARDLRSWTELPVAVSGGYSATDSVVFASPDWDILIVGRSVSDAVDPTTAARNLVEQIHLTERHR